MPPQANSKARRPVRLLAWIMLAMLAIFAFSGAVMRQKQRVRERSLMFLAASPEEGRAVFRSKGCVRCHSVNGEGGKIGPDLGRRNSASPSLPKLITGMWNHAPTMWERMRREHVDYPSLDYEDVAQLLAYLYMARHADRSGDASAPLGDPERGWRTFQQKSCAGCHSIRSAYQLQGPNLGPEQQLPETFSELGGVMLTHYPQMEKAMVDRGMSQPPLSAQEMSDIFAFLYSLRYVEPSGSPQVGASVFVWRGCSRCHGENAQGTGRAPSLRGHSYNSITLAVALWHHGQQMYAETRKLGYAWPTLAEEDVGDLLAFLNLPPSDH